MPQVGLILGAIAGAIIALILTVKAVKDDEYAFAWKALLVIGAVMGGFIVGMFCGMIFAACLEVFITTLCC